MTSASSTGATFPSLLLHLYACFEVSRDQINRGSDRHFESLLTEIQEYERNIIVPLAIARLFYQNWMKYHLLMTAKTGIRLHVEVRTIGT